jgi:Fe-S cluster biogenesis protein NfuA/nitrite reductase/ring-hydroxylating ferredoxin subunit
VSTDALPGELLDRVQALTAELDELPDARARELAQDLVSAVIAMYGDGLRRIVDVISQSREAGETILDQLAQDGAVASLLLIHDLYPVSLEERVAEALQTVRPYMESHGGNVELVSLRDGVARLALQGSCNGCAASRATLELAIKQALEEHAPDLVGLEVDGVTSNSAELPVAQWVPLIEAAMLPQGELRALQVDGESLVLANVGGALLAHRNECASCGEPVAGADLDGSMLRCCACEVEFDLKRAGRAAGGEPLQLTPVPLLEDGGVRVAL